MDRPINKIGLAVIRDGRLLVVRNSGTKLFLMPGGRVEPYDANEVAALSREIEEELACALVSQGLRYLGVFSDIAANDPGRVVQIKLYMGEIDGVPKVSSEIEEMLWFDLLDTDRSQLSPIVANKIVPFLLNGGFIDPIA